MSKIDLVRSEMMAAMKSHNAPRKEALSMLLAALKSKFIDKRADLTEEEENAVVFKEIKQAKETMDTTPPDRTEIIEECKTRIAVFSEFAPQLMDEAQIKAVIAGTLAELGIDKPEAKDKGRIMKTLMPKLKDKAEGSLVSKLVGELF